MKKKKMATISLLSVYRKYAKKGELVTLKKGEKTREQVNAMTIKENDIIFDNGIEKKVVKTANSNFTSIHAFASVKETEKASKAILKDSDQFVENQSDDKKEELKSLLAGNAEEAAEAEEVETVTINCNFAQAGKLDTVSKLVKYDTVYIKEEKARKRWLTIKNAIEENHANINSFAISEKDFLSYAKEIVGKDGVLYSEKDAEEALAIRKAYKSAKEELETLATDKSLYNSLSTMQLRKVRLLTLQVYPGVTFGISLLKTGEKDENGKDKYIDFMPAIKKAFQTKDFNKAFSGLAGIIRTLVFKSFGQPDEIFKGFSVSMDSLLNARNGELLKMFVSMFVAKAKLNKESGLYDYGYNENKSYFIREFFKFVAICAQAGIISYK